MKCATLVIMAAGIGSRFGGGIKQLEPVGPNGEIIMDYSIHDAIEAGFNKIVFVIRREIEEEFRRIIGDRIGQIAEIAYVYQEVDDIPEEYKEKYKNRTKPWGTGQAILCCRKVVKESFVVINADDYYGKEAFIKAYRYLSAERERADTINICMIGFVLKNTLSDNGGVTRGICMVNEEGMLENIVETHNIEKRGNKAVVINGNTEKTINSESIVSMNMWGFKPDFFPILANEFEKFLSELCMTDLKSEFLLPTIIGEQLEKKKISVKVLQSFDEWFGVTYKEDKDYVIESFGKLIDAGVYQEELFSDLK